MMRISISVLCAAGLVLVAGCNQGGSDEETSSSTSASTEEGSGGGGADEGSAGAGGGSGGGGGETADEGGGGGGGDGACAEYEKCCNALTEWAKNKKGVSPEQYKKSCDQISEWKGNPGAEENCQRAMDGLSKTASAMDDFPEECQ